MPAGSFPPGSVQPQVARLPGAQRRGSVSSGTTYGGTYSSGAPGSSGVTTAPPQVPPARKKRRRDPWWAKTLIIAGALLMMFSGTAIAGVSVLLDRYTSSVHQQNLLGDAAAPAGGSGKSIDGALNILMVGIDERPGESALGARADSIMIMHIDQAHQDVTLASVPRDLRVLLPRDDKSHYAGGYDKINAAFFFGSQNGRGRAGGFELLALTLRNLTGITFDAGAIVNFSGFQAVVKALDGVDMCVDEKTVSIHVGQNSKGKFAAPYHLVGGLTPVANPGVKPQIYYPGCQHLNDWQALDYVRQRELIPDGDYGRQRHQQQFVKAIAKKTMSAGVLSSPTKVDAVIRAAGSTLTVDPGRASLTDWLFTLKGINPAGLTMIKTNGGQFHKQVVGGLEYESLDPTSQLLFQDIKADNVPAFIAQNPTWVSNDGGA